eukprot:TRINITY_DN8819_c0_g1_i1.p1 TRINITY_DN8819_c0_g1~~TRINITY_DN8819_c0_g1_i1.p1  ORF type:complete len:1136 (+),score=196.66 TRINITY_DN8819_c0_g1_i1:49-3456(+)
MFKVKLTSNEIPSCLSTDVKRELLSRDIEVDDLKIKKPEKCIILYINNIVCFLRIFQMPTISLCGIKFRVQSSPSQVMCIEGDSKEIAKYIKSGLDTNFESDVADGYIAKAYLFAQNILFIPINSSREVDVESLHSSLTVRYVSQGSNLQPTHNAEDFSHHSSHSNQRSGSKTPPRQIDEPGQSEEQNMSITSKERTTCAILTCYSPKPRFASCVDVLYKALQDMKYPIKKLIIVPICGVALVIFKEKAHYDTIIGKSQLLHMKEYLVRFSPMMRIECFIDNLAPSSVNQDSINADLKDYNVKFQSLGDFFLGSFHSFTDYVMFDYHGIRFRSLKLTPFPCALVATCSYPMENAFEICQIIEARYSAQILSAYPLREQDMSRFVFFLANYATFDKILGDATLFESTGILVEYFDLRSQHEPPKLLVITDRKSASEPVQHVAPSTSIIKPSQDKPKDASTSFQRILAGTRIREEMSLESILLQYPNLHHTWNSSLWKQEYNVLVREKQARADQHDSIQIREKNLLHLVSASTIQAMEEKCYVNSVGAMVRIPQATKAQTSDSIVKLTHRRHLRDCTIDLCLSQYLEVAKGLIAQDYRVAVMILGTPKQVGTVWEASLGAQDESAFQQTNILEGFSPQKQSRWTDNMIKDVKIPDYGGLIMRKVSIIRSNFNQGFQFLETPYVCDFYRIIPTESAKLRQDGSMNHVDLFTFRMKIEWIVRSAIADNNNALVLTAFACDDLAASAESVAEIYKSVIYQHKGYFEKVIIVCPDQTSEREKRITDSFKASFDKKQITCLEEDIASNKQPCQAGALCREREYMAHLQEFEHPPLCPNINCQDHRFCHKLAFTHSSSGVAKHSSKAPDSFVQPPQGISPKEKEIATELKAPQMQAWTSSTIQKSTRDDVTALETKILDAQKDELLSGHKTRENSVYHESASIERPIQVGMSERKPVDQNHRDVMPHTDDLLGRTTRSSLAGTSENQQRVFDESKVASVGLKGYLGGSEKLGVGSTDAPKSPKRIETKKESYELKDSRMNDRDKPGLAPSTLALCEVEKKSMGPCKSTDPSHKRMFRHVCPSGIRCEKKDEVHRRLFIHITRVSCKDGVQCPLRQDAHHTDLYEHRLKIRAETPTGSQRAGKR